MKQIITLFFLFLVIKSTQAQVKDTISELLELPIEKLLNLEVYSASKHPEAAFETPFTSTVLTREQIKNAGSTSIMEALRLIPEIIVREQTNGNYDIHIRGLDNVPPNSSQIFFANSTTLVMIDNRPVYNYLHGGTFWETLPVDLNDVERIEVVKGPSAALYGPNAVSGLINIITRKPEEQGLYTLINTQYGNHNTLITNGSIGYKFNDKLSAWVSGNLQRRDRTQENYYDIIRNEYVPLDSVTNVMRAPDISRLYPDRELAMNKYGFNGYLDYTLSEKANLTFSTGSQYSDVQKVFGSGINSANITTATSNSKYADLQTKLIGFNLQLFYLTGTQSPSLGSTGWKWDFNTTDINLEYNFDKIKNLLIRPGLSYRRAEYDDAKYIDEEKKEGFWNGQRESITKAASLRIEYKMLNEKLRIITGGRLDKFNVPDKFYFSYQLAATYKVNQNNLLRIVQSRANRAPFIIDNFINQDIVVPLGNQIALVEARGNTNLKLLTSDMTEIGHRIKIKNKLAIYSAIYYIRTKDFANVIFQSGSFTPSGPIGFRGLIDFQNLTISTRQYGGTVNLNYAVNNFEFNPFIAIQKTVLIDYSPYENSPNAPPLPSNNNDPATYNFNWGLGSKKDHIGTPSFYGGMYLNYKLIEKLNINLNPYFFFSHTQLHSSNLTYKDGERGVQKVDEKLLVNLAVNYEVTKKFKVFGTARNLLNDKSVEFYKADKTTIMVLGGFNYEF